MLTLDWLCTFAVLHLAVLVKGQAQVQLGETTLDGLSLPDLAQEFFGGYHQLSTTILQYVLLIHVFLTRHTIC